MTTPFKTAIEIAKAYGGKKFKVVRKPSEVWPDEFEDSDETYYGKTFTLPKSPYAYHDGNSSLPKGSYSVDLSPTNPGTMWIIPLDCFDLRRYTNDF